MRLPASLLLINLLIFSCEGEGTGLCAGYDEDDNQEVCFGNRTRAQCEVIITNQRDSLQWRFEEGKICAPPLPGS